MNFAECLNQYISALVCSAKELSDASGVSTAVISRYRSGDRVPLPDSPQLRALARGIVRLSDNGRGHILSYEHVLSEFTKTITGITVPFPLFISNLTSLLTTLGISNNELARALNFDPSYISRILSGKRHPSDILGFVSMISHYIAVTYSGITRTERVSALIGVPIEALSEENAYAQAVGSWLGSNTVVPSDSITDFLREVDLFDLQEYIHTYGRNIDPDEDEAYPVSSFRMSTIQEDAGRMELAFLHAAYREEGTSEIFMYSDFPMDHVSISEQNHEKWKYEAARLIQKGRRFVIVMDVNRRQKDVFRALRTWLPLYMYGQISPYYLRQPQGDVFLHCLRVSDNMVIAGEAIRSHENEGIIIMTNSSESVAYYRKRAERLRSHALPLVQVFRESDAHVFRVFCRDCMRKPGNWHTIMNVPPLYTIPETLLLKMLTSAGFAAPERRQILNYMRAYRSIITECLSHSRIRLDVPAYYQEESDRLHGPVLSLTGLFINNAPEYTEAEYKEHLQATERFASQFENLTVTKLPAPLFRNIQISICEDNFVIITKGNTPVVQFVADHPRLLYALDHYVIPEMR